MVHQKLGKESNDGTCKQNHYKIRYGGVIIDRKHKMGDLRGAISMRLREPRSGDASRIEDVPLWLAGREGIVDCRLRSGNIRRAITSHGHANRRAWADELLERLRNSPIMAQTRDGAAESSRASITRIRACIATSKDTRKDWRNTAEDKAAIVSARSANRRARMASHSVKYKPTTSVQRANTLTAEYG